MDKLLKMKVALILAGGKGLDYHRYEVIYQTYDARACKPILEYQINLLKEHKFTDVWLIVSHLYNQIEEYFGNGRFRY